jgi:transcriptional regulator with XRE-family HTH domain
MKRYEEYRAERAKGKTYQEIADMFGVTRQAVGQACRKSQPARFRFLTPENCIYPLVRKWMNDNKITRAELCRRMGYETIGGNNVTRINAFLKGENSTTPKAFIDRVINVTGLTYEEIFQQ